MITMTVLSPMPLALRAHVRFAITSSNMMFNAQ